MNASSIWDSNMVKVIISELWIHVWWRFPLFYSFTFLLPIKVEDPIEVWAKLMGVVGC